MLQKILDFFEIKQVETGKPPAKTQETPVHEEKPEGSVQAPEEPAIEERMPEPIEPPKIGEEGKRLRIENE